MRRIKMVCRALFVAGVALTALAGTAAQPDSGWRAARGALPTGGRGPQATVQDETAAGGVQRLVYRFPAPVVQPLDDGTLDIRTSSLESTGEPGEPMLPSLTARVALPQGVDVVSVKVVPGERHELDLAAPVRHAQEPYPLSKPAERRHTPRNAAIYGRNAEFPAAVFRSHGVQSKRGVDFIDLVLEPVAYQPKRAKLVWFGTLTVEVATRPAAQAAQAARLARVDRAHFRSTDDGAVVAMMVDNPVTLGAYAVETAAAPAVTAAPAGGAQPLAITGEVLPCLPTRTYKHVIITSQRLRDSFRLQRFQTIAAMRIAQGLSSTIVTVEDIKGAYAASDDAAAVRAFIRDAYNKWKTDFVLLGGDTSQVPMRRLRATAGGYIDDLPSDLYFQCLDGSFNSDGDLIWGELTDGRDRADGRPGDDIDLYAEVAIGRVSVETEAELANWVTKQAQYENDLRAGTAPYLRGALMVGEYLGFGGASDYATGMMEEIRLGAETHGYRTAGFESLDIHDPVDTLYDTPASTWAGPELATLVNSGQYSLLNHLGHCNTTYCMKLYADEADDQYINPNPAFIYTQGCYPGAFDADCIAEHMTSSTLFGFFGGVFNSRYGWGTGDSTDGPSQRYNRWFWHAFFGDFVATTGLMNQEAHERNAARINESCMRWCYYESNLLGDPAQTLFGISTSVVLDREAYRSDAAANVEVSWPAAPETQLVVTVTLQLTNTLGAVIGSTNVTCTRVGALGGPGRFIGGPVSLGPLGAVHGLFLSAIWPLPTNPLDVYADAAPIDDLPPVISGLGITNVTDIAMTVVWNTDELAFGGAAVGTTLPPDPLWRSQMHAAVGTNHTEVFNGLDSFTRHFVQVWAEDLAGNRTNEPPVLGSAVTNDYVWAATRGRETFVRYDFERSDVDWAASNINGQVCWEYGQPVTYGPTDASRCWGTVLNGRYPDGANASLTSPIFNVRDAPVITFRQWTAIQYSLDYPYATMPPPFGDYGQLELLVDGTWQNITSYADVAGGANLITGTTAGWQDVRVVLPQEFANRALRLRFRFVSDSQSFNDGNPAGWYVDDIAISDVPNSGLGISGCNLADSGAGLVGDGDGLAEAGETLALRLKLFNYSPAVISNVTGTLVLLTAGVTNTAELVDGSPAAVTYGTINPAQEVTAQQAVRLRLVPGLLPGTVVTILQTLTDALGRRYETRYDLVVGQYENISGTVVEIGTLAPITNALVTAVRGDQMLTVFTDTNGTFTLTGAVSNGYYLVTASKPGFYSASNVVVRAPVSGVIIALGRGIFLVAPTSLALTAPVNGADSGVVVVSNAVTATAALHVSVSGITYLDGDGWLDVTPTDFMLVPGASRDLVLTASAASLPAGVYRAQVGLTTDDPLTPTQTINVTFTVAADPWLTFGGFLIADDSDGDGHIESGETGDMWIYLGNTNGLSPALNVQGTLTPLDPRVTLTNPPGAIGWSYIPAFGSRLSDNGVGLQLAPAIPEGTHLWFRLEVSPQITVTNTFYFELIYGQYHTITGQVQCLWRIPGSSTNFAPGPVTGAVVTAESTNGVVFTSLPTDTNGMYSIAGVPFGNTWFRVRPPAVFPFVAPAGTNVLVDTEPEVVNLMVTEFGTNAPHLYLNDVLVDDARYGDGDGAIDPGEVLVVTNRLWNDGPISAQGVTGLLTPADMGVGVGPYMLPVDGTAQTPITVPPSTLLFKTVMDLEGGFLVFVAPTAQAGDKQRFWLNVTDNGNPIRMWPFDFALTVNPLFYVAGTVTFANPIYNTPANLAQVRVVAEYPGQTLMTIPAADGSYKLTQVPPGVRVTVSVRAPTGFGATPPSVVFNPLTADTDGVDFTITEVAFAVLPSSLDVTIHEGRSATNTLTVFNGSSGTIDVRLSTSYARGPYDVVTPDNALATLLAERPTDWAALNDADAVAGELEIRFQDGTGWEARQAFLARHGLRALFHFRHIPACVAVPKVAALAAHASSVAPLAMAVAADPVVLYVQPAVKVNASALPNDALFGELYGLHNVRQTGGTLGADIGAEKAWNTTTGSEDIVVAVCDTGVEWTHDDLLANTWENPLDKPGDVNGDGLPGVSAVDDDGDAARQLYYRNPVTGVVQGPELPGNGIDDDGDGLYDETGTDLRDEDVMTADYDLDGNPTCMQQIVAVWDPVNVITRWVLQETWDPEDLALAASDDDENGYADDLHGWCFYDWDNDVLNHDLTSGHGTHVAGTVGAVGNNGIGVAGVNWRVKIMPLCLCARSKSPVPFTTAARIAKAMEYALDQGVRVSNHSWGGSYASGVLYEVMKLGEVQYNHLFVVSAGNSARDNDKTKVYPAGYSVFLNNIVTVAATDKDDQMASFSNWGVDSVQIAAPGVDILSTLPAELVPRFDGDDVAPLAGAYGILSGTSMAAPHVAGAAALLWSVSPDASYEAVKKALLVGSRHDVNLEKWVKSGGHLDVSSALAALGRNWIAFQTNLVTVVAGGSATVDVYLNPDRNLKAGDYQADISAVCALGERLVPVALHVLEQPLAAINGVRIVDDTDHDGFAEAGETVEFFVTLRNGGSGTFADLQGVLSNVTAGVGVPVNTAAWDYLYSGLTGESLTAYRVTLPAGPLTQAEFDLLLTATGADPQQLRLTLPTVSHYQVSGRVVTSLGAGVTGATVEYWGAAAGRTATTNNGYYTINGLLSGNYTLRTLPDAHARSAQVNTTVAGGNVALPDLVVKTPAVSFSTNLLAVTVQQRMAGAAALTITNSAADAFQFRLETMPATKVGLFSDGQSLRVLQEPLRQMGFDVDWYSNNFATVHLIDPVTAREYIVQQVQHTWDDEKVFQYAFVIADLTGSNGAGRVFSDAEADVFTRYLARGGKVLFTGANPLTTPDNEMLAPLVGVAVTNRDAAVASTTRAAQDWTGYFVQLLTGQRLAVTPQAYDLATATNATVLFTAGSGNKLLRCVAGDNEAYLWTGNPNDADWALEGAGRDLLRDILRQSFLRDASLQTALTWLHVATNAGSVAAGSQTIGLTFNEDRLAEPGTYRGVLAVLGNYAGEEIATVPVVLTVAPPTLRVFTSGQVTDWRGLPLLGNGDEASSLYQVISVGTNGVPEPPSIIDGAPGGDDTLLATYIEGDAFGRFGAGVAANAGKFDKLFVHNFEASPSGHQVYVRAWDGASFDASLAYGDSIVRHTVTNAPWEQADFGSWQVTNVVNYTRDSNGDTIPDGWIMKFRPDLDPRAPRKLLLSSYTNVGFQVVQKADNRDWAPQPYRVVVSRPGAKYVYALDYANNRIAIIQTNLPSAKVFYGTNTQFSAPEGMAADPRTNQYRLAVADTQHHTIQLLTYNPTTGVVTFERTLGGYGSGAGKLNNPVGVAMDGTGRIFVADKGNNRIAIFRASDGASLGSFTGSGSHVLSGPQGVAVDDDLDGGVWVCDTANNRVALYSSTGVFKSGFGSQGTNSGQFQSPVDVQLWRMGAKKRLAVVDKTNGRVQIFRPDGTNLLNVGRSGQLAGQLSLPNGCDPIDNEPIICVADTQNGRIQWFKLVIDADADSMNDLWEDLHPCLNSSTNDADADADHDGVSNYGESLIGTNPCNWDSNGNGGSDGWELANGRNPLKPGDPVFPPHVAALTAVPSTSSAGGLVTVTLVYDKPVALSSPVTLDLSGGATFSGLMSRVTPTTYILAYSVLPGDMGAVNAAVSGGFATNTPTYTQDPPVFITNGLFTVSTAAGAAISSITASPTNAAAGNAVILTVLFTSPVTDGTPRLTLSGAVSLISAVMTKVSATNYVYTYDVTGADASGVVSATVSNATDAVTFAPVAPAVNPAAFRIFFAPFPIVAIGGQPLVMSWTAVVDAKYEVQTNAVLAATGWGTLTTVTATADPMSYSITTTQPVLFFRVRRVDP